MAFWANARWAGRFLAQGASRKKNGPIWGPQGKTLSGVLEMTGPISGPSPPLMEPMIEYVVLLNSNTIEILLNY
jgi:hypothetical protein